MKTVKTALTKLKKEIEVGFRNDYVFLKTITIQNIIDEINSIYTQIDKLSEITNPVEIAFFKRSSLKIIKNLSHLATKTEWETNEATRFIGYLISLKRLAKQTYLTEVKGELRTEEERQAIAADVTKIKENLSEHIALEEQLIENKEEFEKLKNALVTLKKSYDDAQEQATEITEWHEQSDTLSSDISTYATTAQNNLTKITTLATTAETNKPKIEKYHTEIEEMIKLFNKQKDEIQNIIDDANRASMAGSFKTQADDINRKMKWADGFLMASLLGCVGISYWGFASSFNPENTLIWSQFLAKSAIGLPLLIVAWIKARERAYLFRLREDYAYKYSSAMAFEGYKKQIQEQDPEMQKQLLQIALDNLGDKPTKVFEKEINATPIESIIEKTAIPLTK